MAEVSDPEKRTSKGSSVSKGSKQKPATVPSLVELESAMLHGLVPRSSYREEPALPGGEPPSIKARVMR